VMGLSMRIFGTNSWALLVPEALMGVASVALLYSAVRRWFGPVAGLLAGATLALTPVAVLMFRFDNPDALLVLLMTAGAYTTVRAVEKGSWKWLALTGVLLGFGFLTKMLQAFLVLPGFALVYLVAAPIGLGRRVRDLLIAGAALVVSGGWFVLLVSLWPASSRPYIAGSTNNTLWQLAIGYNGLGRIFGGEGNPGGGGGGPGGGGPGGGDRTGPKAKLALKRTTLQKVLKRGYLPVTTTCDEACAITLRADVTRKLGKRLGGVKIASGKGKGQAGKRVTIKVKLTRKARKGLRRTRSVAFTLKATATDAAGNTGAAKKKAKVKRAR
jgi:hypothetical protein